jgi:hypothetical protein
MNIISDLYKNKNYLDNYENIKELIKKTAFLDILILTKDLPSKGDYTKIADKI